MPRVNCPLDYLTCPYAAELPTFSVLWPMQLVLFRGDSKIALTLGLFGCNR